MTVENDSRRPSADHLVSSDEEIRQAGEVIAGRYRLGELIGAGAMGAVYQAEHMAIRRRIAIKFLHPSHAGNKDSRLRFRREAEAAGMLQNEHVTQVMDFGFAEDGAPFIVMEELQGETLARRLEAGPLPDAVAVGLLRQACLGVAAAHRAGIVHRDLKPANLFLCRRADGTELVKVLDFGVAKQVSEAGQDALTVTGLNPGTPLYMSPEQARGARDVDHRADLHALGLILYEALAGRRARSGHSYNEVVYRILHQPPAKLSALRADLAPRLAQAVERAMAFEPSARYQSADELHEALGKVLGMPAQAEREEHATGPQKAEAEAGPAARTDEYQATEVVVHTSGATRMWMVVAGVALAATAGVALLVWEGSETRRPNARAAAQTVPPPDVAPSAPVAPPMGQALPPPAPASVDSGGETIQPRRNHPARRAGVGQGKAIHPNDPLRQLPIETANPYRP